MSASSVVIRDSPPAFKVPKLRSSCEECGSAKVKCTRAQPKCSRCVAQGLTCLYGISRKIGRRPRKRLGADFNTRGSSFRGTASTISLGESGDNNVISSFEQLPPVMSSHAIPSRSTQNPLPDGGCNGCTDVNAGQIPTLNETTQPCISDFRANFDPTPSIGDDSSVNAKHNHTHIDSNFTSSYLLDELPQLDIWGPDIDILSFSKDISIGNQPTAFASSPPITSDDESQSHSCPRGSYELFRDLICPSPLLHAPKSSSDTVMARLDEVLHFNSEAIDRLSQLLDCPCARSGHRILVHASIISRILIWYQQAAGWTKSNSEGSSPLTWTTSSQSNNSSPDRPPSCLWVKHKNTDTTSPPILDQSTGFSVDQGPVTVGTFYIQDQDVRDGFRNHLVLSELKKVTTVIELFAPQDTNMCSMNPTNTLASHLGEWLRSEYLKTANMLKERINILNENMDG